MYLLLCHLLLSAHTGRDHYKTCATYPLLHLFDKGCFNIVDGSFFPLPFWYVFMLSTICNARISGTYIVGRVVSFWTFTSSCIVPLPLFSPYAYPIPSYPLPLTPSTSSTFIMYILRQLNGSNKAIYIAWGECVFLQHWRASLDTWHKMQSPFILFF